MSHDPQTIVAALEGQVWHVRINRPHKRNALSMPMFTALAETLEIADAKQEVNVILVSGAGPNFCAGHDLGAFSEWPQRPADPVPRFLHALARARKPMVVAAHGSVVGIGVTWMLHADWVVTHQEAALKLPFVDLGILPEAASSLLLARAIGAQRARRLLMGGEVFTGEQAYAWGLASELTEAVDVLPAASRRAAQLAVKNQAAVRQIKEWLHPRQECAERIDAEIVAINEAVLRQRAVVQEAAR